MGRHQAAAAALARPALDGDPEVALWRAAAEAELEAWEPAQTALATAGDVLASYPLRLQFRLGLPVARIHARAGRAAAALAVLDRLSGPSLALAEQRRVALTRGLVYRDIGALDAADATWQRLEGGPQDRTSLEAALARRVMLVEAGRLSPEQALQDLAPLRPAWRGHPQEAEQLATLAGMLASTGRAAEAIRLWQEALQRGAGPELASAIERSQRDALVDALLESGDAWVGPLRAYALYRDFQELLPAGDQGVEVRRSLAARLATIDQIDAAARLLQEALAARPGVTARTGLGTDLTAELGAELGALWLRYPDPERALAALKATAVEGVSPALAHRRALLLARAALGAGDPATARAALAPFDDPEAARIRAELLWTAGDWRELQASLRPLVDPGDFGDLGDPGDIGGQGRTPNLPADARRTLLVEFALASLALGDQAALDDIAATEASRLAGTAEEAPFRLITALADTPPDPAAVVAAAERRIEAARAFLDHH
jgi:tetratricopeptide (TPR) repeat protein